MTANPPRHRLAGNPLRARWAPLAAAGTAAVLTVAAIAVAGAGSAGAATALQAQSVGNFLDAAVAGQPIDQLAKLAYARATAPGTQSTQNPLDATVLNALEVPLTGALQLPNLAGITLGAVNQVAVARTSGEAYGASGLVQNSGGVSIGGDNSAYPSDASIDLCASALVDGTCGSTPADALGELKLTVGAVAGLASTPKGYGTQGATKYQIASLGLQLGAPQLGQLLGQVNGILSSAVTSITGNSTFQTIQTTLGAQFPGSCDLSPGTLPNQIDLGGGAGTIDVANSTITVNLEKLLDLNAQPANTDLVSWLSSNLSSLLTTVLTKVVGGLVTTLSTAINSCVNDITAQSAVPGIPALLSTLTTTVTGPVLTTLGGVLTPITDAVAPLLAAVASLVDIGVNVQPNGPNGTFDTGLDATPKQGTPVVAGQTIVRAIEVDVLSAGQVNLPAVQRKAAAARKAQNPLAALALGNAAAGPGTAPAATSSPAAPSPSTSVPATNIPTGVPAGQAPTGGSPALPITLLGLALLFAAGGVTALRLRGRANTH